MRAKQPRSLLEVEAFEFKFSAITRVQLREMAARERPSASNKWPERAGQSAGCAP